MPQCAACALPPPHFGPLRRRLEWPAVALPRCTIQTIVRWTATTTTRGWSSFGILKTGRLPGTKSGISWSSGLCLASGKWKRPLPTSKTLFACKCISIYLSIPLGNRLPCTMESARVKAPSATCACLCESLLPDHNSESFSNVAFWHYCIGIWPVYGHACFVMRMSL